MRAADAGGVAVLAPDSSRGATWDLVVDEVGPDVAFLDAPLREAFRDVAVDPGRVAIGGFSDGASYALSIGMANGLLFGAVLAFSPGFALPPSVEGRPRIFVSHGDADPVLPVDRCSRALVPRLRARGYDVRYREFAGAHAVPPHVVRDAVAWWLDGA